MSDDTVVALDENEDGDLTRYRMRDREAMGQILSWNMMGVVREHQHSGYHTYDGVPIYKVVRRAYYQPAGMGCGVRGVSLNGDDNRSNLVTTLRLLEILKSYSCSKATAKRAIGERWEEEDGRWVAR